MEEITVIILVYNSEKYIKKSIDSIINQTFKRWKLIIINDGSTDDTIKIINSYTELVKKKLLVINNKKNLGINLSMNQALTKVNTQYFTRQDSDDISDLNRLAILIESLKKNNNYDFVSSRMISLIKKDIILPTKLIKFPQKEDFIKSLPFCNAPTLFRSNILSKVKYNESQIYKKRFEDYEFFFKCYLNGYKGFNIDKVTYFVRQDYSYQNKITIYQRFIEFLLKLKIYKKFNLDIRYFLYVLLPLIKIIIPSFLFKIYRKIN